MNVEIEYLPNGPYNDLFLALNYYISTGDHIGEGIAIPIAGSQLMVLIAYAPKELEDKDNWQRLEARLKELQAEGFPLTIEDKGPSPGGFTMMAVTLPDKEVPHLTTLLKERPGPLGWGSIHTFLQDHGLAPKD